jgi:hypothetical protein
MTYFKQFSLLKVAVKLSPSVKFPTARGYFSEANFSPFCKITLAALQSIYQLKDTKSLHHSQGSE